MVALFGNKKIKAFGLDISDVSIKVMQLEALRGRFKPVAYADVALSDKVINNHMIISEERLADNILRALATAKKISTQYVVCSIPEAKSFVRTLEMPKMPDAELENAIPFELEQDIPIPVDQVYLDWQVIGQIEDKLKLMITAAPKEYVDALSHSLRLAKLVPVAMELESQATARALVGTEDLARNLLIVDLATRETSFIIIDSGVIQYTSSIPIAGSVFTESIARNLGVPAGVAEDLKRSAGLMTDVREGNIRQAVLPVLDNVVDEIKNVIKFFEEHDPMHKTINEILLCGGSARMSGIVDYISGRINDGSGRTAIPVGLGNPWVNVAGHSMTEEAPMSLLDALGFTTVVGLALRGVQYEAD
jgi:type IV pilus assembly protein PilM